MYSKPTIYNLAMATAGTEYSQALPANLKKVVIRSRNFGTLKIAFVAAGTTAGPYFSIPAGSSYAIDAIYLFDAVLKVNSDSASDVAEILAFSDQ